MGTQGLTAARIAKVWIDIIFFTGVVVGPLLALYLVVSPLTTGPDTPRMDRSKVSLGSSSVLPVLRLDNQVTSPETSTGSARVVTGHGELRFTSTRWSILLVANLGLLLWMAVVLFVLYVLRSVLQTVIEGRPFVPENARRVRLIGIALIAGTLIYPILNYLAARMVLKQLAVDAIALSAPVMVDTNGLLVGLLVLALATIFGSGARLERDQSLTI